jgi:hypothetical protein
LHAPASTPATNRGREGGGSATREKRRRRRWPGMQEGATGGATSPSPHRRIRRCPWAMGAEQQANCGSRPVRPRPSSFAPFTPPPLHPPPAREKIWRGRDPTVSCSPPLATAAGLPLIWRRRRGASAGWCSTRERRTAGRRSFSFIAGGRRGRLQMQLPFALLETMGWGDEKHCSSKAKANLPSKFDYCCWSQSKGTYSSKQNVLPCSKQNVLPFRPKGTYSPYTAGRLQNLELSIYNS